MRHIAQPLDPLGQVALEPPAHHILADADDLGDLRGGRVSLGSQKDHLGACPEPHVAVLRYRFSKAASCSGLRMGIRLGFMGFSSTHKITPLGINLFVLRRG